MPLSGSPSPLHPELLSLSWRQQEDIQINCRGAQDRAGNVHFLVRCHGRQSSCSDPGVWPAASLLPALACSVPGWGGWLQILRVMWLFVMGGREGGQQLSLAGEWSRVALHQQESDSPTVQGSWAVCLAESCLAVPGAVHLLLFCTSLGFSALPVRGWYAQCLPPAQRIGASFSIGCFLS